MKKLLVSACLLSASVAGFAGEGEIKDRDGFYNYISVGSYQPDSFLNSSDETGFGLGLGYYFNKNWSVEIPYNTADLKLAGQAGEFGVNLIGLDAMYSETDHLGILTTHPFLKLGVARSEVDLPVGLTGDADEDFIKLGVGLNHFFNDIGFVRLGHDFLQGDDTDNEITYLALGAFWGETHRDAPAEVKAPAAAPKDSDGDGVIDANDRCPGTPAGARVDSYGCPLDSDGDGVYDYQDACPNTPAGAKVDEKGCQVQAEKVVIDMRLNFDTNKYAIKPEMVSEIAKVAEFLRQFSNVEAEIQGHTDSVGSASYNQGLSERRAKSVVDYLVSNFGIDASRLSGAGYGETRPIADNATAEGRALNRRAEANLESK